MTLQSNAMYIHLLPSKSLSLFLFKIFDVIITMAVPIITIAMALIPANHILSINTSWEIIASFPVIVENEALRDSLRYVSSESILKLWIIISPKHWYSKRTSVPFFRQSVLVKASFNSWPEQLFFPLHMLKC